MGKVRTERGKEKHSRGHGRGYALCGTRRRIKKLRLRIVIFWRARGGQPEWAEPDSACKLHTRSRNGKSSQNYPGPGNKARFSTTLFHKFANLRRKQKRGRGHACSYGCFVTTQGSCKI